MLFIPVIAALFGFAVAAPAAPGAGGLQVVKTAPSTVRVKGVSLLGTGCPAGTGDVQVDATGTLFEATFSAYEVQTGPKTEAAQWRKNCKLTINMEFDAGFQFTIVETDMIGFAEIPAGVNGQCKNTFSFTGSAIADKQDFTLNLRGHYTGDFNLHSDPGVSSMTWSPCKGTTAILNMNTQCSITPTNKPALIAVDHISGMLKVKFATQWRPCRG